MKETCPICNNANHCGISKPNVDCWCTKISFPSIDVEKMDLPDRCICLDCAKKLSYIQKNKAT